MPDAFTLEQLTDDLVGYARAEGGTFPDVAGRAVDALLRLVGEWDLLGAKATPVLMRKHWEAIQAEMTKGGAADQSVAAKLQRAYQGAV
jgi:hypothetical protein